ncbi:MAG TPA: glycosyltransferase family 4 protein [Candidatus Baltobacteraceae bacterium]|jgi:glycosyltransferase involved in cell wall biosynthesis|nr:glycosyltransferase family 4 protein [Candidatus Baltobacteraceae bacterium]
MKLVGIINGDPWNRRTWSGCAPFFFGALKREGYIAEAISSAPPVLERRLYQALAFRPNRDVWRHRYYSSVGFAHANERTAKRRIARIPRESFDALLQVGAYYNLTNLPGIPAFSYHDTDVRSVLDLQPERRKLSGGHARALLAFEAEVYKGSRILFTMSRWAADRLMRNFEVESQRLEPVGAGMNLPAEVLTYEPDFESCHALFVGFDFELKGGRILLEAFARVRKELPHARLSIVGPNSIGPVPPGVTLLGRLSKDDPAGLQALMAAYRSASVFVMPSLFEPFGVVFVEAMACGLPCIGTNTCAMPEIIGDAGIVVTPGSVDELTKQLYDVMSDPSACAQLGAQSRERFNRFYTWDRVAERIGRRATDYMAKYHGGS